MPPDAMSAVFAVERVPPPTPAEFRARFFGRRPVVIRGLTDGWRMRTTFTFDALARRWGEREVAVAATAGGVVQTDLRAGVRYTTLPLADCVARLADGARPDLYVTTPLHRFLPDLIPELDVPPYCCDAGWRRSRLWMSAAGTVSPLHWDPAHNLVVQLEGRKRFWLYEPAATRRLYPHRLLSKLPNFSRFDPEQANDARFPLARTVPRLEVTLEAGEVLYLPSRWWHHVRSLERSLSVNFWWARGWLALVVRAAEVWQRLRGFAVRRRQS